MIFWDNFKAFKNVDPGSFALRDDDATYFNNNKPTKII